MNIGDRVSVSGKALGPEAADFEGEIAGKAWEHIETSYIIIPDAPLLIGDECWRALCVLGCFLTPQYKLDVSDHTHPRNPSDTIRGSRLEPNDVIKGGDMYDSSTGMWEYGPEAVIGATLGEGAGTIWVRPG